VVPDFCQEVVTSNSNQQFATSDDESLPSVLVVEGRDNFQACFERSGVLRGSSSNFYLVLSTSNHNFMQAGVKAKIVFAYMLKTKWSSTAAIVAQYKICNRL